MLVGGFPFNVAATKSATSRILLVVPCAQSRHGCIERDEVLYLQVALTVEKVTVLTYRLVRDTEGLGIDAATITAKSVNVEV